MIELPQKTCAKCKDEKYHFEFSRCKTSKDGLRSYCKACYKQIQKAYIKRTTPKNLDPITWKKDFSVRNNSD